MSCITHATIPRVGSINLALDLLLPVPLSSRALIDQVRNAAGQIGYVPASYLKMTNKKPAPLPAAAAAVPVASNPAVSAADYHSSGDGSSGKVVRAVYPYAAQRIDELTVAENDEIVVLEEEADGWFRGRLVVQGVVGWLPLCFVAEVAGEQRQQPAQQSPPKRHTDTMGFSTALLTSYAEPFNLRLGLIVSQGRLGRARLRHRDVSLQRHTARPTDTEGGRCTVDPGEDQRELVACTQLPWRSWLCPTALH